MAYTTNQLISGAYYASGVVSREFETVSGPQISDGLQWLNDILTEKVVDKGMIPYESTYQFNASEAQEKYFIPNLVDVDTLVFYKESVRFSMTATLRNQYFGSNRVENIQSLPFEWYWEKSIGGGNLYIYFTPDQGYPMEIHGAFALTTVELGQDLSQNIATIDLGVPIIYSGGALNPTQLVVNNYDLAGNYPNVGALVNYINTGIIPGVTASINVNDFVLSSTTQPVTPIYIQTSGYTSNTNFVGNVAAATTGNLVAIYSNGTAGVGATLTSTTDVALVVDGYSVNVNDRILVIAQTDSTQNGSYIVTVVGNGSNPWVLTRTTNYNQPVQIGIGNIFTVVNGTVNGGDSFIQTAQVTTIGTSTIIFLPFSALSFSNFSTIETPYSQNYNGIALEEFYLTYLRYALADRICAEYNYTTPPNVIRQLGKYEAFINNNSKTLDLRIAAQTSLTNHQRTFGWAYINIGRGWFPN